MHNETTTVWQEQLNDLDAKFQREEKKYPLSDRDRILYEAIKNILIELNKK